MFNLWGSLTSYTRNNCLSKCYFPGNSYIILDPVFRTILDKPVGFFSIESSDATDNTIVLYYWLHLLLLWLLGCSHAALFAELLPQLFACFHHQFFSWINIFLDYCKFFIIFLIRFNILLWFIGWFFIYFTNSSMVNVIRMLICHMTNMSKINFDICNIMLHKAWWYICCFSIPIILPGSLHLFASRLLKYTLSPSWKFKLFSEKLFLISQKLQFQQKHFCSQKLHSNYLPLIHWW